MIQKHNDFKTKMKSLTPMKTVIFKNNLFNKKQQEYWQKKINLVFFWTMKTNYSCSELDGVHLEKLKVKFGFKKLN